MQRRTIFRHRRFASLPEEQKQLLVTALRRRYEAQVRADVRRLGVLR